jgi:hypothetical protein
VFVELINILSITIFSIFLSIYLAAATAAVSAQQD